MRLPAWFFGWAALGPVIAAMACGPGRTVAGRPPNLLSVAGRLPRRPASSAFWIILLLVALWTLALYCIQSALENAGVLDVDVAFKQ